MRILLDNCIDRNFARLIVGHEVRHAHEFGWRDFENGRLLSAAAAAEFAAMVTVDKNIRYQQNLAKLPVSVIELDVRHNRIDELSRFASYLAAAIERAKRFSFVSVRSDGSVECLVERRQAR